MPLYDILYLDSSRLSSYQQQLGTNTLWDTLESLRNGGYVRSDLRSAGLGFVEVTGDLFLLSHGLLEFAASTVSGPEDGFDLDEDGDDSDDDFDFDDGDVDDEEFDDEGIDFSAQEYNPVQALFKQVGMPSVFVIANRQREVAGGPLREDYLTDSVSSCYVRAAPGAIQRVTVIGIGEPTAKDNAPLPGGIANAVFPMMSNIFSPMLPEDAVRITPVVMYRQIAAGSQSGQRKQIR